MSLFCSRMWLGPPWAHRDPGWFRAATRKERPCFAAECGPDPFGHTRALEGPFFDPKTQNPVYSSHTRKERPCFATECGFGRLGHTGTLEALEQPHEKNGPVLLGPFFDPKTQNPKARSPEGFRGATRKERRGPGDWHLAQAKMHIV